MTTAYRCCTPCGTQTTQALHGPPQHVTPPVSDVTAGPCATAPFYTHVLLGYFLIVLFVWRSITSMALGQGPIANMVSSLSPKTYVGSLIQVWLSRINLLDHESIPTNQCERRLTR